MAAFGFGSSGCDLPAKAASELPSPENDPGLAEESSTQYAVLAAGCFWCVEAVFEQLDGVSDVVSGYAGGAEETADYESVSRGITKHAEVVQVTFDPSVISYGQLLRVFFATHDPTTLNRQGPDRGTQYRSAVFYADDTQQKLAESYIEQLQKAEVFDADIVTTLEPLTVFHPAEQYHQDFVERNPRHPYVQRWAIPKVEKTHKLFDEYVRDESEDTEESETSEKPSEKSE